MTFIFVLLFAVVGGLWINQYLNTNGVNHFLKVKNSIYWSATKFFMKLHWVFVSVFLFIACCKKNNRIEKLSTAKGRLTLSRQWFTTFNGNTKTDEKYESVFAHFIDSNHTKDAGIVKYGDSTLHQQPPYILVYGFSNSDIPVVNYNPSFDGGKTWSVTGNVSNDIAAFNAVAPNFPTFLLKNFDTLPVLHKSLPFTISWDASVPCDSLSIGVFQSYNVVHAELKPGNISSITFTPSQLSVFDKFDKAYIIIEGWNYNNITVSGMSVTVEAYARRNCSVYVLD